MKKSVLGAIAGAVLLSLSVTAPANAGAVLGPQTFVAGLTSTTADQAPAAGLLEKVGYRHRRRRRHLGIAAGLITLGVIGAIASDRAHSRRHYRPHRGYRGRCHRWRRWCRRGNDRACWKFDTRC